MFRKVAVPALATLLLVGGVVGAKTYLDNQSETPTIVPTIAPSPVMSPSPTPEPTLIPSPSPASSPLPTVTSVSNQDTTVDFSVLIAELEKQLDCYNKVIALLPQAIEADKNKPEPEEEYPDTRVTSKHLENYIKERTEVEEATNQLKNGIFPSSEILFFTKCSAYEISQRLLKDAGYNLKDFGGALPLHPAN